MLDLHRNLWRLHAAALFQCQATTFHGLIRSIAAPKRQHVTSNQPMIIEENALSPEMPRVGLVLHLQQIKQNWNVHLTSCNWPGEGDFPFSSFRSRLYLCLSSCDTTVLFILDLHTILYCWISNGEAVNSIFQVFSLTRAGIEPEFTVSKADAPTTQSTHAIIINS